MESGHVDGFLPSTSGLKFTNHFPSGIPIVSIELPGIGRSIPIGDASNGVCGGMVYAVLDLFTADPRLRVPEQTSPPDGDNPLTRYLTKRLVDSFALERGLGSNVARYMHLMSTPDHDTYIVDGVASVIAEYEWPKIKRDIDAGRPSPLGLVAGKRVLPTDFSGKVKQLGHCHQVLAYAYDVDDDRLTLHVYDPNDPGNDTSTVEMSLRDPSEDTPILTQRISSRISGHGSFRAFFRHDHYTRVTPPDGISPGSL
ncbi:MAG TPA: hypothetical protein VH419_00820 [Nocardioidaceae bacterium]